MGPGWQCWEVGAGGRRWPRWLADRVGPTGRCWPPTSTCPGWDDGRRHPAATVTVARHDVVDDPLPAGPFDLIHARLVLVHLPGRHGGRRGHWSACCARAGGWWSRTPTRHLQPLACIDEHGPDQVLANRVRARLPRAAGRAGCRPGVRPDAAPAVPRRRAWSTSRPRPTSRSPRRPVPCWSGPRSSRPGPALVADGLVTAAEIDRHLANLAVGALDVATAPMVSARGRRPGDEPAA